MLRTFKFHGFRDDLFLFGPKNMGSYVSNTTAGKPLNNHLFRGQPFFYEGGETFCQSGTIELRIEKRRMPPLAKIQST